MTTYSYTDGGKVTSRALERVYYDEDTSTLYVVFHNGRLAAYADVESSTYHAFMEAGSVGQFYNSFIYGRFSGVSVDQDASFVQRKAEGETGVGQDTAAVGQKFTVVYDRTVTEEYEEEITANSVEDALRQFNYHFGKCDEGENVKVKRVAIHFD